MASEGDKKKITLRSSDSKEFEVEEAVAMESQTIRDDMIEGDCADNCISLPNIHSKILSKVIEYCHKHVYAGAKPDDSDAPDGEVDLKNWDAEFVKLDLATLLDLIVAAGYLNIEGLEDLTCQTVADMIKGMTLHEIRNNIKHSSQDEKYELRMAVARLLLE